MAVDLLCHTGSLLFVVVIVALVGVDADAKVSAKRSSGTTIIFRVLSKLCLTALVILPKSTKIEAAPARVAETSHWFE